MLKRNLIPVASIALLIVGLIAANVVAALVPLRIDVTQARLFTLTDGTRRILQGLKDPVTVKLYLPDSVPDAPVTVKTFARRAKDLLQEYQSNAQGKLTLQIYDPKPDTEDEDWATRYGLTPAQLPDGSKLYLGMVVLSGGREAAIPFLDPRRERFLEYDVSQAIARVNQAQRPKIAILPGLPIYGQQGGQFGQQMEGEWTFVRELRKSYQVDYLFPQDLGEVPDGVSVVIALHPKNLSEPVLFALDQFLLRGGKLIVMTDPNSRLDPMGGQGMAGATNSNLEPLYKAWGVKFDANMVVADQQLATRVNTPSQGVVSFPLWLTLHADQLNRDLVITSQLEEITLIDPGAFSLEEKAKYKLTPILSSTGNSGLIDLGTVRFASPLDISKQLKTDGKVRVLAGLLTGTFDTAFPAGRPKPPPPPKPMPGQKAPAAKPEPLKPLTHPLLAKAAREGSILLIGDVDFIADRFSVQTSNFFGNAVTQPINDNLSFILNAVEFMAGSQDLIQIRSRGQVSRPFTRLANMQLQAAKKFQEREQFLTNRLEEVKKKLVGLESQKQEGQKLVLTPAQMQEVKGFREEEARVRGQLRDVRKVLRQDIENLGNVLLAINLLVVPLIVSACGFVVILRRGRRRGGSR